MTRAQFLKRAAVVRQHGVQVDIMPFAYFFERKIPVIPLAHNNPLNVFEYLQGLHYKRGIFGSHDFIDKALFVNKRRAYLKTHRAFAVAVIFVEYFVSRTDTRR
jgi:hypothetical protein